MPEHFTDHKTQFYLFSEVFKSLCPEHQTKRDREPRNILASWEGDAMVLVVLGANGLNVSDAVKISNPTVAKIELAARFFAELDKCYAANQEGT
jgi:hypothetical protein